MMRRHLLPVLLLLSATLLWASPRELTVTVIDQELGTPLQGVRLAARGVPGVFTTDAGGKAALSIPEGGGSLLITAELPGYQTKKSVIAEKDTSVQIAMVLSGVVEGNELVVEKPKPNSTEAQSGVSQVVTKDDISNLKMGVMPDVMSTIKTLPGVSYTRGFNAMPSIQGGNPSEMTAELDGAYVLYPYHWGGAVSIFNPDMVESAMLSDGVASASYGQYLSGLLQVTSISPNMAQPTMNLNFSTDEVDVFASAPIGSSAGVLLGGKVTFLQVPLALFGRAQDAPFITEGFGKLTWNPSPRFSWFLDAYAGIDGVTLANFTRNPPTPPDTLATARNVAYSNGETLLASAAKLLVTDNLLLNLLVNFNTHNQSVDASAVTNGTQYYDQDFINAYSSILNGATSFTLNDLTNTLNSSTTDYLYQLKADLDWQIAHGNLLSFGVESLLRNSTLSQYANGWQTVYVGTTPEFLNEVSTVSATGNNTLTSAVFGDYNFSFWSGLLSGEAGVRGNYTVVFNSDMTLLTRPSVDPRIRLVLTPVRNQGVFDSFSLIAGTGLFSQFPVDNPYIDTKYGISNYQVGPTLAWFNELGLEAVTKDGWKLDVDGYYKSYSNRFYAIQDPTTTPVTISTYFDGTGYAYGVDALIQKNTRFWQGWLSYSYVITRLYNPAEPGNTDTDGDPTGTWFFPSYNIQHTISLVLTLTPSSGFSFTTEAQIASGAPLQALGPITSYEATLPDGTVVERFSRTSDYSDTLRGGWSFPVDVKASWHGYFSGSKVSWELYLAVQDILAPLYAAAAAGPAPFDPWSGQYLTGTQNASFNAGVPIPSVGLSFTY